jgi:hypothetical protein
MKMLDETFVRIYLKKRILLAILLGLSALSGYETIIENNPGKNPIAKRSGN